MIKKNKIRIYIFIFSIFFLGFGVTSSQYFYYDTGIVSLNEYQQGCNEKVKLMFNTDSAGANAGRVHIKLDKTKLNYLSSSNTSLLRTDLLEGISNPWPNWAAPNQPIWVDTGGVIYDIIDSQRRHNLDPSLKFGEYGFLDIKFIPKYSSDLYTVDFGMDYDGTTTKTALYSGGGQIINPILQNAHLTGTISVERHPCILDSANPQIQDTIYSNGDTKVESNGLNINLTETTLQGTVPFVRTGGLPGIGVWTGDYAGNVWGINNQYGINSGTVSISVAGNGTSIVLTHNDFSRNPINIKTRQYKNRDYNILATSGQLFTFGIEKIITISYSISDRLNHVTNRSISFNHPHDAFVTNIYPLDNQIFVALDDEIKFKISDDWAGVDSGSVIVTLSGVDNNYFGIYSGTDLNFSGVVGVANFPDYDVILNHSDFPTSGIIHVNIYGTDLENNGGDLLSWTFTTRPNCVELNCCSMKLQTGDETTQFDYMNNELYISGGNNAYLTGFGTLTGYIDCNTADEGLIIYKGHGDNNTGVFIGFHDLSQLRFEGTNVKAVLSGDTIVLTRITTTSPHSGGGGGGGGGIVPRDYCPEGDLSVSYYDGSCGGHSSPDFCGVDESNYSSELKGAYLYSYMYGITTMCPIEEADLDGYLYRNHFAKMASEFAMNVLGKKPDVGKMGCNDFDDIRGDTEELRGFIKTACELSLLGMHADGITPQESFYSTDYVTRAQFGTVFSRMLFGDKYNIEDESEIYKDKGYWYKDHLNALKEYGIMTKIHDDWPDKLELRGWVMLMMQRADNYGLFVGVLPVLNGIKALFD